MQLVDDRADSRAAGADARADRIDAVLRGEDRDLRARAGLTGDGLDLHEAGSDLRDLELKEPLDQARMRPGDDDLRASGRPADLHDVDADEVALVIILRADLLGGGEHGVGLVVAAADADGHVVGRRLDAQDRTGEDLMLLRRERVEDHAALGLADALDDDLLGRLGRDAAEGLRLHVDVDQIAQLRGLADLAGRVERDLGGGGDDVVDDFLLHVHVHIVVLDLDKDVIGIAVLVLLVCGDERLRDLLDHVALRDPAFFFQLRKRRKNFGIHVFEIPPFKTRREAAPARPRFSGMYVWPLRPRSSPRRLRSR